MIYCNKCNQLPVYREGWQLCFNCYQENVTVYENKVKSIWLGSTGDQLRQMVLKSLEQTKGS